MPETLSEWWKRTSKEMRMMPEYKRWAKWMSIRLWFWDHMEKPLIRLFEKPTKEEERWNSG